MRPYLYGWLFALAAIGLVSLAYRPTARATAQDEPTLTARAYLPLLDRPLLTEITFGTAADSQGRPSPPMTTIQPGARQLYYNVSVDAGGGRAFRIEYILPGGPIPPDIGTLPSNDFDSPGMICYTDPSIANCDSPTGTLAPGTYTIRLFIDDQLVDAASATVLPSVSARASGQLVPRVLPAELRR